MKCGDRGFKTAAGTPCGQNIGAGAAGCIWHLQNADGRRLLAIRGNFASRMKRAPPSTYQVPEFDDEAAIIRFARELARLALTEDVDPRRVAEARGAAALALQGFSALTQAKLVDALLTIEHGGPAMILLNQLKAADGPKRLLPWKVPPAAPVASGSGSSSPPEAEGA